MSSENYAQLNTDKKMRQSSNRSTLHPIESNIKKKYVQLFLDAGQNNVGPITCKVCHMSYNKGTEDDLVHAKFHKASVGGIDYPGYKSEVMLQVYPEDNGSRVVMFSNNKYSGFEKRKLFEILEIVTRELGSVEIREDKLLSSKIFLYVTSRKKVVGCVIAEHIKQAYRATRNTASSHAEEQPGEFDDASVVFYRTEPIRAVCGISRIWVSRQYRRKGIATKLLDLVRKNYIYGCCLGRLAIAFSQPTGDGKALATNYTGTSEFLVYTEEV
ncbi:4353_t:CDS:2 [Paraglomus occultum]|uniref:4353_t:CDS:1 n=1 Tax=Paraglomus occultum TaxID=144539 RepID=A0A9N8W8S2_9GLOM|nr:4353_t:CDS:2 [Paraglomus occultum]